MEKPLVCKLEQIQLQHRAYVLSTLARWPIGDWSYCYWSSIERWHLPRSEQ